MLHAITFDLWDTLVVDDGDEPARAAQGLPPKPEARLRAFAAEVRAHHPHIPDEAARAALDAANARFKVAWRLHHRTPHLADRLRDAFGQLGIDPTPGFDTLVDHIAGMEVRTPPPPTPGVAAMLASLHGRYPLGIVSDAIVTPGAQLRELLERHDLLRYFSTFVFSDEVGAAKPDPAVFHAAAAGLGVSVQGIVHIGDREANDIAGPAAAGARSVLYTGAVDRGASNTQADAVCHDWAALADTLAALET